MEFALLALKPLLEFLVTYIVIPAIAGYATFLAQKHLGIKLDDKRQKDLSSALETGWRRAFAEDATNPSIETVVAHVTKVGAPEAVKHFHLSDDDVRALAPAKKVSAREKWLKAAL